MTKNIGYLEQYNRVERTYQRLIEINSGKNDDHLSDYLFDDFINFFMNCYHLKDWIKNDPNLASLKKDSVEKFINESNILRICADIANGAKHCTLSHKRSNSDIKKGYKWITLETGLGMESKISAKYSYIVDGNPIDAFDLATACLQEWKKFIKTL